MDSPPSGAPCASSSRSRAGSSIWLAVLCAAVSAALLGWPLLLWAHERFPVPEIPDSLTSLSDDSPEVRAAMRKAQQTADFQNAALGFGLFGAVLAGVLAAAHGAACESLSAAARCLTVGGLLGALLGACGGLARVVAQGQLDRTALDVTVRSTLSYAVALALTGLAAGLAIGISQRDRSAAWRSGLAGASGGLVAGALYPFLAAVLLPLESADQALPTGALNALFFAALSSLLIAGAVARTVDQPLASSTQ